MRYTTLIDISELPDVYHNKNARLLYMHMVLKSGYHDQDRDLLAMSIRRLASDAGLTLSATRFALAQLEQVGLLKKEAGSWRVKKWIVQEIPTPRTQKTTDRSSNSMTAQIKKEKEEAERFRQALYKVVRSMNKEQLQAWLQELEEGKSRVHDGVRLQPNLNNRLWLQKVIETL